MLLTSDISDVKYTHVVRSSDLNLSCMLRKTKSFKLIGLHSSTFHEKVQAIDFSSTKIKQDGTKTQTEGILSLIHPE